MMTAIAPSSLVTTTTKTTTTMLGKATTISSIPVRAIPVPNSNKLILAGPCIVLRTATVAEQVQALRQEKKAAAAAIAAANAASSTATTVATAAGNTTTTGHTTPVSTTAAVKKEPQTPELLRCKRRADLGKLGFPEAKPVSVSRRNARERNRVKLVNQGFETLREYVPNGKKNRKMSKVDTLRSAVEYIRQMQELIREHDEHTSTSSSDEPDGNIAEEPMVSNDDSVSADNSISSSPSSTSSVVFSLANDIVCNDNRPIVAKDSVRLPTRTTDTMTDFPLVDNTSEEIAIDCINNNNNNNKFINFNTDNDNEVNSVHQQMDIISDSSVLRDDANAFRPVNMLDNEQQQQQANSKNLKSLDSCSSPHLSPVYLTPQTLASHTSSSSVTTTFVAAKPSPAFFSPSSGSALMITPSAANANMAPQSVTLITLPLQQTLMPSPSAGNNDDVFLTESQQRRILASTSPGTNRGIGTVTSGTMATLTTLQGVGSLSSQGLTIPQAQPCRRHLSFMEPETTEQQVRQPQQSPTSSVSTQPTKTLLLTGHQQNLQNHINQQHLQEQQQQDASQTRVSFTLLPGQSNADLSLLNRNDNSAFTLATQQIPMDQQHHQQQQQQLQQQQQQHSQHQDQPQPQYATLSNLALPDQSESAALSMDQSATASVVPVAAALLDNQQGNLNGLHHRQTLALSGSMAMMQPQLQVDQVPSPSFSTTSSHTSESSYESYESLGSLEEDLQDISNWITELCNSAQGEEEAAEFLAYSGEHL